MPKGVRIVDRDRGYRALLKRLRRARKRRAITVGVHSDTGGHGALSVVDIASIHEFGLGTVPERSFLRAWFDRERIENERIMVRLAESVIAGKNTVDVALEKMGLVFVGGLQKFVRAGIPPALAPATVARKGSSTPLIDTGQLVSSMLHKVE
jgi:hypothetical protein